MFADSVNSKLYIHLYFWWSDLLYSLEDADQFNLFYMEKFVVLK